MENVVNYFCQIPVVLIIFNRPEETEKTLLSIKRVKPKKLFIIADGPRQTIPEDLEKVRECRGLLKLIDWECEVVKFFSEDNLGCMKRVVTGLDLVFNVVDKAIILEDDCVASVNFFRFTEWGLNEFQNDPNIGMISGSNLISHKHEIEYRNGFSNLINIWGWATWKSVWTKHNSYLSIFQIQQEIASIRKSMKYKWWQSIYWKELFKYTVYAGSTWDFQLQFTFFKFKLRSVYPCKNLVYNIGFSGKGTHTNTKTPEYILKNLPNDDYDILKIVPDYNKLVSDKRDNLLAHEIWHFNPATALRLLVMNYIRLNR